MGRTFDSLTPALTSFIEAQHLFFVATAPAGIDGHVNLSLKGCDTLRVLDERRLVYLDLTGSGIETVAHLRQNGRITLLFAAFDGPPQLVRVWGRGEAVLRHDECFDELSALFEELPGTRAVIDVSIERVGTSCGYGVPLYRYEGERSRLVDGLEARGPDGVAAYWAKHVETSIDGLPGLVPAGEA